MSKRKYNPERRRRSYLSTGQKWAQQPLRRFQYGVRRAEKEGSIWELSLEQYTALLQQPCVYGGELMEPHTGVGLDQRIPGAGYTVENSMPCCPRHNKIKGNELSHDDMLFLLEHRPHLRTCAHKPERPYGTGRHAKRKQHGSHYQSFAVPEEKE